LSVSPNLGTSTGDGSQRAHAITSWMGLPHGQSTNGRASRSRMNLIVWEVLEKRKRELYRQNCHQRRDKSVMRPRMK
jgi:hypothetical protein